LMAVRFFMAGGRERNQDNPILPITEVPRFFEAPTKQSGRPSPRVLRLILCGGGILLADPLRPDFAAQCRVGLAPRRRRCPRCSTTRPFERSFLAFRPDRRGLGPCRSPGSRHLRYFVEPQLSQSVAIRDHPGHRAWPSGGRFGCTRGWFSGQPEALSVICRVGAPRFAMMMSDSVGDRRWGPN